MNSFYTADESKLLRFKQIGENAFISRKASIYQAESICIGHDVRIDDFCILSGNITIKNYVHIAAYSGLYGGTAGIEIDDFANISSRITIYAVSDDYSGESMTNPMIPEEYKNIQNGKVHIFRHTIVGSGSLILPGVTLGEGCAIGALSLVNRNIPDWTIWAGIPAQNIGIRSKNLLNLEKKFMSDKDVK